MRAWIEDDYGDGHISTRFYSNEISNSQKKIAKRTRKLVEEKIGTYEYIRKALINPEGQEEKRVVRARNMATRSLSLQWVNGDAEKAESSFFKINTQGTPLDSTEETLLRNRRRSVAIASRSIVRAGTGHKYWSKFPEQEIKKIEDRSKKLHDLFFAPEINQPIKTLDLPLGGTKSPLVALDLLMSLIAMTSAKDEKIRKEFKDFPEDPDGTETIKVLDDCLRVMNRITGNEAGSLGLHPAVYFYSDRGRHIPDLLLAMILVVRKHLNNNDSIFFKKFTEGRGKIESILIEKKTLIIQALQNARSKTRVERASNLFEYLIQNCSKGTTPSDEEIVSAILPQSDPKILTFTQSSSAQGFSEQNKSQIYLRDSLKNAIKCKICDGLIEPAKSVSYDHVERVREGGRGNADNGQMTHPYCNTGFKN